jgi:hypothetical protein
MTLRRTIVGVLLLAAALLGGCGGNGSADRNAMENKFQQLDYRMSSYETLNSQYNQPHFEQFTQHYIALVRKYADLLGPTEAKRRLKEKGDELGSYCLPCVGMLDDEASRY